MLIDYTVNHIIWGNFEIEDESIWMFGSSNFFIPMKQSHVLFACTWLERINEIDQNGEVTQNFLYFRISLGKDTSSIWRFWISSLLKSRKTLTLEHISELRPIEWYRIIQTNIGYLKSQLWESYLKWAAIHFYKENFSKLTFSSF